MLLDLLLLIFSVRNTTRRDRKSPSDCAATDAHTDIKADSYSSIALLRCALLSAVICHYLSQTHEICEYALRRSAMNLSVRSQILAASVRLSRFFINLCSGCDAETMPRAARCTVQRDSGSLVIANCRSSGFGFMTLAGGKFEASASALLRSELKTKYISKTVLFQPEVCLIFCANARWTSCSTILVFITDIEAYVRSQRNGIQLADRCVVERRASSTPRTTILETSPLGSNSKWISTA